MSYERCPYCPTMVQSGPVGGMGAHLNTVHPNRGEFSRTTSGRTWADQPRRELAVTRRRAAAAARSRARYAQQQEAASGS